MVSFLETQSLALLLEMNGFPEACFVQSLHLCLAQPLAPLCPPAWAVGATQSPPRQRGHMELEGLAAGAWLSVPLS